MSKKKECQVYVVFEGRVPGMYFTWPSTKVQVNGYSGNIYVGYDSFEEALTQWIQYCVDNGRGEAFARSHIHGIPNNFGCSSTTKNEGRSETFGHPASVFAEDTTSKHFVLHESMQNKLQQVCTAMTLPQLVYTMHEVRMINNRQYSKCHACLGIGATEGPHHSIGGWAKNEYDGKEDVAALLLGNLLSFKGKQIRDYNYYNVKKLEKQLKNTQDENQRLIFENEILMEELRMLKLNISGV